MRVEIREGGDGVACWNTEAITAYATAVDEREAQLAAANPDLDVSPGLVMCYGCEVMDYQMGTRCTASLTRTVYRVRGEIGPRAEDAEASLSEIDGLITRLDADPADDPELVEAQPAPPARSGIRGLFRRG